MELIEQAEGSAGRRSGTAVQPQQGNGTMGSQVYCAYNQTRECFLGLEVRAAELSPTGIEEMMSERPLKSGEGLWLKPFRGISAAVTPAPLDLIYLDDDSRVIETVESFPTMQASSSSPRPASVLALPAHSIYSSQTQVGDQMVLCVAEEMERRLERLTNSRDDRESGPIITGAALLREKPLWSGGPGVLELENRSGQGHPGKEQPHQMDLAPPGNWAVRQVRAWLKRWWSPDPRRAPRVKGPGLAAYYWNGTAPVAHRVRDISASGLYLVTEERWYPGTLVLMTLQKTQGGEEVRERSVSVHSRAVRWGTDGVGMQFVLADDEDVRSGRLPLTDPASREDFYRFLEQLKPAE